MTNAEKSNNKKSFNLEDLPNFPDAPDFVSKPINFSFQELTKMNEAMLPYWNKIRFSKPIPIENIEPFVIYDEL